MEEEKAIEDNDIENSDKIIDEIETFNLEPDVSEKKQTEDAKETGISESLEIEDEVIVTIGDEEPEHKETAEAPPWVKELRKSHRDAKKENRALKEKLEALERTEKKPVQLGKKPILSDFDYDPDKFEQEFEAWHERKRILSAQNEQREAEQKNADKEWQEKLNKYNETKESLKVRDFDDSEAVVLEMLSNTQQGIIVQGSDNSAVVVYALGKNPEKAKEISSIKDPVKFAFAIAKLEKDLKVKNRKSSAAPERTINGTASKSGIVDSNLERLRAEASRTGDYSKVIKYKSEQKQKAKK